MESRVEPRLYSSRDLRVGLFAEFERAISEDDIIAFSDLSGDRNPLHVDVGYAAQTSFQNRIVHGAFQMALASAMLGMYLPGRSVLLGSVSAHFHAPLFYPSKVIVHGEITAWNLASNYGNLKVLIIESEYRKPVSEISMGFTLRETVNPDSVLQTKGVQNRSAQRRQILITGAGGGIAAAVIPELIAEYDILALINRRPLHPDLMNLRGLHAVTADISTTDWEEHIRSAIADRKLHGVLHAAWPGAPRGGLLDSHDEVITKQITFGVLPTIRLARLLCSMAEDEGGRFIALGSIFGRRSPTVSLATYSLGKSVLEDTVKLLAPELARKRVTINSICPSFLPVGLNSQSDARQQKLEAAKSPMGRLCAPTDISAMIKYLLSPGASFISGQSLVLSGGRL